MDYFEKIKRVREKFEEGKAERRPLLLIGSHDSARLALAAELVRPGRDLPHLTTDYHKAAGLLQMRCSACRGPISSLGTAAYESRLVVRENVGEMTVLRTQDGRRIFFWCNECNAPVHYEDASVVCLQRSPMRAPHHSVSESSMAGYELKGVPAGWRPGEIHLAHGGLLILDEADKFSDAALDAVEAAYRDQGLKVGSRECPADFDLVLTVEDCPCRNWRCVCGQMAVDVHRRRSLEPMRRRFRPVELVLL